MTSSLRAGLIGAGVGSTSMFFLDSVQGARRRAVARDKAMHIMRIARRAAGTTSRDVANHVKGLRARLRRRHAAESVSDEQIRERVRSALGRATSHPRAILATVTGGCAILTGDALESEIPSIVRAVERVPGVEIVQNELRPHKDAGNIPALQGGATAHTPWAAWLRGRWSPTAMLAVSAAAGAIAMAAAARARRGTAAAPENESNEPIDTVLVCVDETGL